MPNRTVYLPDALDAASRQLGLNLSQLTQRAIEAQVAFASDAAVSARCAHTTARMVALEIQWPDDVVATGRREAAER
ncbi:MAG TPA: hypothetical protein PK020_06715 [Ilumatobacteraceae bacterium]|nr:hypothetical protein [Ilumatobacteraceae bacterium]HRB04809.1 hypothetical protein [Ilumatobacteraceae bacterium]